MLVNKIKHEKWFNQPITSQLIIKHKDFDFSFSLYEENRFFLESDNNQIIILFLRVCADRLLDALFYEPKEKNNTKSD